VHDESVGVPAK